MSRTGIIAEFNPFHNGHKHIIDEIKRSGDSIICAVSGNFVQRGDLAVFPKEERAKAALAAGADAVVEIPSVYSMSTAQNFALAGVWQLYNMGCEKIVFGSESGDIKALEKTADILLSDEFSAAVSKLLKSGETFAKSREKAALMLNADISLLRSANDNLGIEYIIAAKKLRLNLSFDTVRRVGDLHDGNTPCDGFASGSYIRELIKSGDFNTAKAFMPEFTHHLLNEESVADTSLADRAVLALLRAKEKEDFSRLPDISEGIENRLFDAVKTAHSIEGLCEAVKTKRYTLSRIRRLVFSAALGFDNSFFMVVPPYTRVLGIGKDGKELLKNTVSLNPIVTKASDIEKLDTFSKKLFSFESKATDLYSLFFKTPRPCGREYTVKFINAE